MRLLAMVKEPAPGYLKASRGLTQLPPRSPSRPAVLESRVLRPRSTER